MPTVREYMTQKPHFIDWSAPLATAHRMMRQHSIHHLPVLRGHRLVGVVSMHDLHLIETLADVDREQVTVEEAMRADPFVVLPDAPVGEVAQRMAAGRYESALVMKDDVVVGVFTTTDALRALEDVARQADVMLGLMDVTDARTRWGEVAREALRCAGAE